MARIRSVKPEFWSDEKLSPADPITRLVFLGLISMADDCGRLIDNLKQVDAFIFPETEETAREALARLSEMGRIRRGKTSSGQRVIQIVNWERHQKVDHPNRRAAFPELLYDHHVMESREVVASDSRESLGPVATRSTIYDQRSTTDDDDRDRSSSSSSSQVNEAFLREHLPASCHPELRMVLSRAQVAAPGVALAIWRMLAIDPKEVPTGPGGKPVLADEMAEVIRRIAASNGVGWTQPFANGIIAKLRATPATEPSSDDQFARLDAWAKEEHVAAT